MELFKSIILIGAYVLGGFLFGSFLGKLAGKEAATKDWGWLGGIVESDYVADYAAQGGFLGAAIGFFIAVSMVNSGGTKKSM